MTQETSYLKQAREAATHFLREHDDQSTISLYQLSMIADPGGAAARRGGRLLGAGMDEPLVVRNPYAGALEAPHPAVSPSVPA